MRENRRSAAARPLATLNLGYAVNCGDHLLLIMAQVPRAARIDDLGRRAVREG